MKTAILDAWLARTGHEIPGDWQIVDYFDAYVGRRGEFLLMLIELDLCPQGVEMASLCREASVPPPKIPTGLPKVGFEAFLLALQQLLAEDFLQGKLSWPRLGCSVGPKPGLLLLGQPTPAGYKKGQAYYWQNDKPILPADILELTRALDRAAHVALYASPLKGQAKLEVHLAPEFCIDVVGKSTERVTFALRCSDGSRLRLNGQDGSCRLEPAANPAPAAERPTCSVCLENSPDNACKENGHVCVCSLCLPSIGAKCPICRSERGWNRLYFS